MRNLTADRLREVLEYHAHTGEFFWLVARGPMKAGSRAGCVNKKGYLRIKIDHKLYLAHRLAFLFMTGSFPEADVDFINCIASDNRWCNLRPATRTQNQANRRATKANKLKAKGVVPSRSKFAARIKIDGKDVWIGTFDTVEAANAAYAKAAKEAFGKFARAS